MAEKRMFAKTIVLSDAFLDMPMSARCLYFTLGMLADDDGFVNSPKSIMRQCGASDDDLRVLMGKKFLIAFETGVIVIKHWRINNYLRNDRYQGTKYTEEKSKLEIEPSGAYSLIEEEEPLGIPSNGIPSIDKNSIDKTSLDKNSIDNTFAQSADEPLASVEPIPLNDGSLWIPTQSMYEEYCRLYPNVDVDQEFRNMRGWCDGNPSKRKTKAGVKRFVSGWLSRSQDSPKQNVPPSKKERSNWTF